MSNLTDDDLPGYCSLHCRTERALFHRDHIVRLYQLAGKTPPRGLTEWVVAREAEVDPLVVAIEKRKHRHLTLV